MKIKTSMKDWTLEYRKSEGVRERGWYWHLEIPNGWGSSDVWDYGAYQERSCAIDDFKEMAEYRGFEVVE